MKIVTVIKAVVLALFAVALLGSPVSAAGARRDWTHDQYRQAFDEVARNYGAIEYATYTFMVEFHRAPESLQELRDTGHLNVQMTNPYTGGEVKSLTREDIPDGNLAGNYYVSSADETREADIIAYYVRIANPPMVHSMIKRIYLYTSSVDHKYFENDLPRDEQMTAVYCMQAVDAFESLQQKIGKSPENFDEMYEKGDVNVHYINPVTKALAVSSGTLSAGDFYYKKIGDEGYELIGWGRERPVFFACTDDDASAAFYAQWPQLKPDADLDTQPDSQTESQTES
jgi:hypothetical protein